MNAKDFDNAYRAALEHARKDQLIVTKLELVFEGLTTAWYVTTMDENLDYERTRLNV